MKIIPHFIRRRIAHRPYFVKIVDNIGWLFFDKILRMGIGLIVGIWLVRYLGPEQFGQYSFAISLVGLFGIIPVLGLQNIVVRDIVLNPSSRYETLGTAFVLQFIGSLISYLLIIITIYWLRPEDVLIKTLVVILGSVILFKPSEVVNYWFESQVLSKYSVWVQNISIFIFAIIKIGLIINNAPLITFAWVAMAEALIISLLLGVLFVLKGPQLHKLYSTLTRACSLIKDCWPLLLAGISVSIYLKVDQIMLGQMVDIKAVGIYSAATRISEIWFFIPVSIVASVFPAILKSKKISEELYDQRLQSLYDLMAWLSIGIALPITFLSTPIVLLLYGESYRASSLVMTIHIWSSLFVFLGVASSSAFIAENRQIFILQRTMLGAISNVCLNLWLIPIYHEAGAAFSTLVSHFIVTFLSDLINKSTRKMFLMKISALNLLAIYRRYF